MLNVSTLTPEACVAVADFLTLQARALYARHAQHRRQVEAKGETRQALRQARERQAALLAAVDAALSRVDGQQGPKRGPADLPRSARARLAAAERAALERAAERLSIPWPEAELLYRVGMRRRSRAAELRRDHEILTAERDGVPSRGELAKRHGVTYQAVGKIVARHLAAVDMDVGRALAALERDLAHLEPKEEPAAPAVVLPSVFEGPDGGGTDRPILQAISLYLNAGEDGDDVDVEASPALGIGWRRASSASALQFQARAAEASAAAEDAWNTIVATPAVSVVGVAGKLHLLGDMLADCSYEGPLVDLFGSILADAMRLAGGPVQLEIPTAESIHMARRGPRLVSVPALRVIESGS